MPSTKPDRFAKGPAEEHAARAESRELKDHEQAVADRKPGEQLHTGDDPVTDMRHFEGSFLKVTKDGATVMSNTLEEGEVFASSVDDRSTYHENEKVPRADAPPTPSPAERRAEREKAEAKS